MSEQLQSWSQLLTDAFVQLGDRAAELLPRLVGTLVILLVGWLIAWLVAAASERVLRRLGLDHASERLEVGSTLRDAGISGLPSRLIARVLFWLLMLTFVLSAFENLGLEAVSTTIDRLIAYLPNVIAAALILVVGAVLARFVGNLVGSGASAANLGYARQLGSGAQGAAMVLVGILALEQLGVATDVFVVAIGSVITALAAGLALAFALGSRDVVRAVLAGHYVRRRLAEGQRVEIDGRSGVLERIGPVDSVFRNGDRTWSVPNAELLEATVVREQDPG